MCLKRRKILFTPLSLLPIFVQQCFARGTQFLNHVPKAYVTFRNRRIWLVELRDRKKWILRFKPKCGQHLRGNSVIQIRCNSLSGNELRRRGDITALYGLSVRYHSFYQLRALGSARKADDTYTRRGIGIDFSSTKEYLLAWRQQFYSYERLKIYFRV